MADDLSGTVIDIPGFGLQYFAIPKVACSSVMAAMADLLDIEFPDQEWKPELFQTHKWDGLYDRSKVVLTKRQAFGVKQKRVRFALVRNPWDRLVSCYSEKIREDGDPENFADGVSRVLLPYGIFRKNMDFADFVEAVVSIPEFKSEPHWRSQFTFLIDDFGRMRMDFLGRFENVRDLEVFLCSCTAREVKLPHLLASSRTHYRDYYTPRLRNLVAERYARDIRSFKYAY
ncbi:sulfotransferase family 2 domain-containing protein [Prosthecomicrobium sp. N25]|uniref:sulfotransferase family 2 domain-containing protein n=1 Tax=Prosthecomicrobium sp. N25 TaxID=3129254 RepID=UPI003078A120